MGVRSCMMPERVNNLDISALTYSPPLSRSESFNDNMVLYPSFLNKVCEDFDYVRFSVNRIDPSVSSAVIDEGNIIIRFAKGGFGKFSAKVGVN